MPTSPHDTEPVSSIPSTIGYFAAFSSLGVVLASLGPTLPNLADSLGVNLGRISILVAARSLGYLLGSWSGGRLYDRLPGHVILSVTLLEMALFMALAPLMPSVWLTGIMLLLVGFGLGLVDVGGNTLLLWLHGSRVGPYINGMFFFGGLGGFIAPLLIAQVFQIGGGLRWAYWAVASLLVPISIYLMFLPTPRATQKREADLEKTPDLRSVGLFGLFLFLYIGAEAGMGDWVFSYVLRQGLDQDNTAALITSSFWIALTIGRLLAVPLTLRVRPLWILAIDLVGTILSLAVVLFWRDNLLAAWIGIFGAGFWMASIFPTTLSIAERSMPITGRVTGWIFAMASAGGLFLPWLIGQLIEASGPGAMMVALIVNMGLAVVVFFWLQRFTRKHSV